MRNEFDFSKVNEILNQVYKENKHLVLDINQIEVYIFPQTWGSTAMGFDEVGCRAVTVAYTIVALVGRNKAYVYFNGRFAYKLNCLNAVFLTDLYKRTIARYGMKGKYEEGVGR